MPLTVETCFHICLRTKVSGTCRVFTHRTYLRNFPERTERETPEGRPISAVDKGGAPIKELVG